MCDFKKIKYDKALGSLKCGICGNNFKKDSEIYISEKNTGFICKSCIHTFSKEDIEEFLNLFNRYGGHFGKFKFSQMSLETILDDFFNIISHRGLTNIVESNLELRHRALIFGYTPSELIEKMRDSINTTQIH